MSGAALTCLNGELQHREHYDTGHVTICQCKKGCRNVTFQQLTLHTFITGVTQYPDLFACKVSHCYENAHLTDVFWLIFTSENIILSPQIQGQNYTTNDHKVSEQI